MVSDPRNGASMPTFTNCNIYLLKEEITLIDAALTEGAKKSFEKRKPLSEEPKHEIFVKAVTTPIPMWLKNVEALCDQPIQPEHLPSISRGAVIFLYAGTRLFALTFGQGWRALKTDAVDLEFGYEAANRLIDKAKIDSVSSYAADGTAMSSLKKVFQGLNIGRYRFNPDTDSLRSLSGACTDARFGEHVSGSTPFLLTKESTLPEIAVICAELLKILESTKDRIWENHRTPIRNKKFLEKLDVELGRYLNAGNLHNVSVSPPDLLNFNGDLRISDGTGFNNLFDLEKYLQKLRCKNILTKTSLSRIRIEEYSTDGGAIADRWSLWECLDVIFECEEAEYCLNAGEWYKVDPHHIERLNTYIDTIETYNELPAAIDGEKEPAYNKRAADAKKFFHFDTDLVRGRGYTEGAELCDLFGADGNLINLKLGTKSSLLSHLFNQGMQSAYQSRVSHEFRQQCIAKLKARGIDLALIKRFDEGNFEVIFGILSNKKGTFSQILPYQAKLALKEAHLKLASVGIKVRVAIVHTKPRTIIRSPGTSMQPSGALAS